MPIVVALLGIAGIIFTQWRADRRQDRAKRQLANNGSIANTSQQREAAAELIAAVWELARISVDVLPPGEGDWTDLHPEDVGPVEEAQAKMYVLSDARLQNATDVLAESLRTFVGSRTQSNWDAIEVDQLIDVLNRNKPLLGRREEYTLK